MDTRWQIYAPDSRRATKVLLHPTAAINDVRTGVAADAVDLTPYVGAGSQGCFEAHVTLSWNHELDGANQPAPNQVLEIQLYQSGAWQTLWIGIIEQLSSYAVARGTRQMELIAKSRDSLELWRTTKRVSQLYPQLTNLSVIANDLATTVGLLPGEIVLPPCSINTAHSNTQMADMSTWEMLTTLFLPVGWTPFVDGLGRLRAAARDLQSRAADLVLSDAQLAKVLANRSRPPCSRVTLQWLDPNLAKSLQQGRQLMEYSATTGWFIPYLWKDVYFSADKTQRAENTYMVVRHSANGLFVPVCLETYHQNGENSGQIQLTSLAFAPMLIYLILEWYISHAIPDGVVMTSTVPVGRLKEGVAQLAILMILTSIGTGQYEIWGNPYEWVHARNTTMAQDSSAPIWIDNPQDVESDFIVSEAHAQAVAVRELIYRAKSANKWTVQVLDHPGIEYGDIVQLADGSRLCVEDFNRPLMRASEPTLELRGFLA